MTPSTPASSEPFCASPRPSARPIRRTTWSTRAGFPRRPRAGKPKRVIIVIPQWNGDALSHNAFARLFRIFGVSTLRLSMPYHDIRMPAELHRADYSVSSNIGRTIHAARQGIIDIRCCVDWLEQQGYTEFGVLGTSLGSCYAFNASAHDARIRVNIFNHASTYFGDVVWTGFSTRHVRAGIEKVLNADRAAPRLRLRQPHLLLR